MVSREIVQDPFSAYREHSNCKPFNAFSVYPEHSGRRHQNYNSAYREQFRHIGNSSSVYPDRIVGLSGTLHRPIRNSSLGQVPAGSQSPALDSGSNFSNPFNLSNYP